MPAKITNGLPQFVDERERKAAQVMAKILITGAANAAVFTPVRTSYLLNSQYKQVLRTPEGNIRGLVGYTANYAAPVHDPEHSQRFRRATAKKLFLKLGFEEARSILDRIFVQGMK